MPAPVEHLSFLLFQEGYSFLHQFPEGGTKDERGRGQGGPYRDEGHYGCKDLTCVSPRNLSWSLSCSQETHEIHRVDVGPSLYQMQAFGPYYHYSGQ